MEKTVQNIPFLRITIALAIGIVIDNLFTFDIKLSLSFLILTLILLVVFNNNYKYIFSLYFGLGIQIFFIFLGITISQQFNKKPFLHEKGNFTAIVLEAPQEKPNSYKSVIQIDAVYYPDSVMQTNEKVIAYFAKNETVTDLKAGDIILFNNAPQPITNNNNPFEFDYKKYLERKKIYRQVYLSADDWTNTNKSSFSLICQAEQIRERLLKIYRIQPIDETEFEILSALTLGYKRELDPETKRIFSASGAMHVLAVSGLHVGIVFWIISILFGFLQNQKTGSLLFMLISISILWIYAFITGLSPSVMRASTMFTIFVIGDNLHRKSNIYNSLAASAFLLLLINPNNLFDTGFQLSYTAVFGIVFLQPKLEKLIIVKNSILKFFWSLITVSIAAQIATFPITTYYFGQFPTYFMITNSFVIPAVMLLIPLGISLLLVSKINILANVLAIILNYTIKIVYFLLSAIEQFPFSVLQISIGQLQLFFIIAILCSIFIFLVNYNNYFIKTALYSALLLSLSTLVIQIIRLNNTEIIVYNMAKNPTVQLIHGKKNYVVMEEKPNDDEKTYSPVEVTRRKLGLNPSIVLLVTDSLTNENIFLKNRLIFFEGKSISIQKNIADLNKNCLPDFIINPINLNQEDIKSGTEIITNKKYFNEPAINASQIHYTSAEGAFRKNW